MLGKPNTNEGNWKPTSFGKQNFRKKDHVSFENRKEMQISEIIKTHEIFGNNQLKVWKSKMN